MGVIDPFNMFGSGLFETQARGGGFREIPLTEAQREGEGFLSNLLGAEAPQRGVAGLTDIELGAQDRLRDLVLGGIPGLQEAAGRARGAAAPQDITKLPEFQAIIDTTRQEGNLLLNRIQRALNITGTLTSGGGRDVLGRAVGDVEARLTRELAPFISEERGRQFAAIPLSAQLAERGATLPIQLGATFGGVERDIEGQRLLEQYLAELFPFNTQALIAGQLLGQERYAFQEPILSPSILSQIGGVAATAAQVAG